MRWDEAAEADRRPRDPARHRSRRTGCVVKLAGHERLLHRGPARVFDSEEACFAAVKERAIQPGDVVVIRYEGPAGGPGCARCCTSPLRSSARGSATRSR